MYQKVYNIWLNIGALMYIFLLLKDNICDTILYIKWQISVNNMYKNIVMEIITVASKSVHY